jgi:rubredoxin
MQIQSVTINFTGGIVSPGYLKEILEVAQEARVSHVRFGLRQQLIMEVPAAFYEVFKRACTEKGITAYRQKEALPNIVSSYPAAAIFTTDSWMREGVYKDIFDSFHYTPQLKINICDSQQSFVPFATGHINWVSSHSQHFWHLYIRFPKTSKTYRWKEQVYTNDIPALSQLVEKEMLANKDLYFGNVKADGDVLFRRIKGSTTYIAKTETAETFPDFSLPYYEGFNKVNNQLWLGIYRRDELFPVSFLIDVCHLCMQTRIGQLYTTPWKSIIIKNIDSVHRKLWDIVLGRYRINVRHAANELNWQVEDYTDKGLQLKGQIIRYFDKEDVRTYGLCFAVQMKPCSSMFGSVVIRKQQNKNPHRLKALERYDILYKKDFNPNTEELILFRDAVQKDHIGTYLVSLCKDYYEQKSNSQTIDDKVAAPESEKAGKEIRIIHQCPHCQTVYVPAIGDEEQGIAPGTGFEGLPSSYSCPLCEAPKEAFVAVAEELIPICNGFVA